MKILLALLFMAFFARAEDGTTSATLYMSIRYHSSKDSFDARVTNIVKYQMANGQNSCGSNTMKMEYAALITTCNEFIDSSLKDINGILSTGKTIEKATIIDDFSKYDTLFVSLIPTKICNYTYTQDKPTASTINSNFDSAKLQIMAGIPAGIKTLPITKISKEKKATDALGRFYSGTSSKSNSLGQIPVSP